MKILLIPLDYHRHKEDDRFFGDMLRAFQKQSDARIYDGNIRTLIDWKPNVVFYQGSLSREECIEIKKQTGCKWTTWTGDCKYAPADYLIQAAEWTDQFYFPFSGEMLNRYSRLLGKPCVFQWEYMQDWKFREPKNMQNGRVTFVGNKYDHLPGGKQRKELMEFCWKHIPDCTFYGNLDQMPIYGGQIPHNTVPALYNDSYIVIAENNMHDIESYFTPRNLMGMAAGSCTLMRWFPAIDDFFDNWKHCVIYKHKYELLDIINFLRDSPETRNRIAVGGYEHAKRNFCMDQFAKQYISKL